MAPQSQVKITYTGNPGAWSQRQTHVLSVLRAALDIRLREVIREDLGGSYGVSVQTDLERHPVGAFRIDVSFGCAPENVDKLTRAVFREIKAVKDTGFKDDTLRKVIKTRRGRLKQAKGTIGFWLRTLLAAYSEGDNPQDLMNTEGIIKSIRPDALKQAAKIYLNGNNRLVGVLNPQ